MNNRRYCLHCFTFDETRQEMHIDRGNMEATAVTRNGMEIQIWEAQCPRCGSLEYFVTMVRKERMTDLFG